MMISFQLNAFFEFPIYTIGKFTYKSNCKIVKAQYWNSVALFSFSLIELFQTIDALTKIY
jgi:hypothetical protein